MIIKNQKIRNTSISLDGGTFEHCDFDNCKLTYSGYLPVVLSHCKFGANVKWNFAGPATNTLMFMQAIYSAGATELIENAFEQIRGNPPKSGPTLH